MGLDEEHPLQYAFAEGTCARSAPVLNGTQGMTDEQVFAELARRGEDSLGRKIPQLALMQLQHPAGYGLRTERYDRCPACEQWSPCRVREAAGAGS